MEERDDLTGFVQRMRRLLSEYADLRIGLLRLQAIRTLSRVFSSLMVMLTCILMGLLVMFFLGLALSAWVSDLTGSPVAGHLSAAVFFLVLFLLAILLRRPLFQAPMIRIFLAASTDGDDEQYGKEDEPLI
jgi:uncharacterized oligopeptide transporter (OPT) family protein